MFHPSYKILNEMIKKEKTHDDKGGLGYLSKSDIAMSGKTTFIKSTKNSFFGESSSKQALLVKNLGM